MKKTIVITLALAAIAVGWFIFGRKQAVEPVIDNGSPILMPDSQGTSTISNISNDTGKAEPPAQDNSIESKALKIISKPIVFGEGLSDSEKQKIEAKIKGLTDSIKQNYNYLTVWLDLGNYRKEAGDYNGAIEAWKFAILIRPDDFIAYNNLGELYGFVLKNYQKAEEYFLKSIKKNSQNINAYIQLVTIYTNYLKDKYNQIENLLLQGIKDVASPTNYNLKIALGDFYKTIGKKDEAIKYYEEALKINPNNPFLLQEADRLKSSL